MAGPHKIIPSNPRLSALLSDVTRGNIKIPVFQRDYVWTDEQIMGLLDSIYHGYPVGSLLMWSTKEVLKHERNVGGFRLPETPEDYPVNYVLDGQQRLTTLFGVFNSSEPTADESLAARFNVAFDTRTQSFVHQTQADPSTSINLRLVLDTTTLFPELERFGPDERKVVADLTERFKDYEFPVVTIKDRTNQEVCRIFQRINSSGTTLSTLELLSAWTWSDQFNLRNELEEIADNLSDRGYAHFDEALVMRSLAALVVGNINSEALVDADPGNLINGVATLKEAIHSMVDFLGKELRIKNAIFLPFPIMVVPLIKFFSEKLYPNAAQLSVLKKWFWHCAFTQRYKAGTNTKVVADLEAMARLAKDGDSSGFPTFEAKVDPSLFKKTWRINSTAAKATICLLAQSDPRSFINGSRVDLDEALSAYNAREFHHIYPKAYLASKDIGFHESNVIANICLLTSKDNRAISDNPPYEYFADIASDQKEVIFNSALIPLEAVEGDLSFANFVEMRAQKLAECAESLINNQQI